MSHTLTNKRIKPDAFRPEEAVPGIYTVKQGYRIINWFHATQAEWFSAPWEKRKMLALKESGGVVFVVRP